jgi:quercetin dioxygenase-like cupin family protein
MTSAADVTKEPEAAAEPEVRARPEDKHKDRLFVREIRGAYSEIYEQLHNGPRVFHSGDIPWSGGPQHWNKSIISPTDDVTQMFHCHMDVYAPGGRSQRHAHINSAIFYILEGRGYDVHDGVRYDWEAGDVCIVENACVHQHFNADPDKPAKVVVMKAKPLFIFAHMMFQRLVQAGAKTPVPGHEDYAPED